MITRLCIDNYALIRHMELSPGEGFNIITGETGAGKSILLGALGLLRGNRAEQRAIKSPGEKSVVEAEFALTPAVQASLAPVLAASDIDDAGTVCILRREILPSGRSRAFVNDTPVTLTVLGSIADRLVDIHSQHKNLLLADSGFQLRVLDSIAGNGSLLERYHAVYADYRAALKKFADTRQAIEHTRADADYIKYQLDELTALNPAEGEEEELQSRRDALAATETVAEALSGAGECLTWGDVSACELVQRAVASLQQAYDVSPDVAALADRLETLRAELDDIAESVAATATAVGDSPAMLAEIDNRLQRLSAMMVRHKVTTAARLIEVRDQLSRRLMSLADADNILGSLEQKARALKRSALEMAGELSARRRDAAAALAAELRTRAVPLALANLVVDIQVTTGKLNPDGTDTVDFLFAFNKNQEPQSIGATASGGEISRVMLALKSILAGRLNLPTIIFDEIDTGVSGDVAARMGAMMHDISRGMQVITITHLPAVAAAGTTHFKVYKRDTDTATETYITRLDAGGRRREIAAMLGGNPDDAAALAAAASMLDNN